jgi:hypothetical protein
VIVAGDESVGHVILRLRFRRQHATDAAERQPILGNAESSFGHSVKAEALDEPFSILRSTEVALIS